ncbi:MAG: DNA-directed RNA polymerase subunit omega [Armatimonadetes bacterium]|nr:DNA-directed RNA polymerase subunit omega [Armatimonadota bacterium]
MRKKTDFELIEENGGKYALVMGITKRAKQLNDGARRLADSPSLNSVATAIEEVAQGRLKVEPPELPRKTTPSRTLATWPRDPDA